jgi:hypothetical protein
METTYNCHYRTCRFVGILERQRYREKCKKMFFMQRREKRVCTLPGYKPQQLSAQSVNILTLAIHLYVAELILYNCQIII